MKNGHHKSNRLILMAVLILLHGLGLIPGQGVSQQAIALDFEPVQNLSNSLSNSDFGDVVSQVATSGSNVYVVWQEGGEILFRRSTDDGISWDPPLDQAALNLSNNPTSSVRPKVVASGPNVFVLWQDNTDGSASYGGLLFRRSTNGGSSFDPTQDLGATPSPSAIPNQLLATGSNIYVVWADDVSPFTPDEIRFRRSTDGGATWDPPLDQPGLLLSTTAGPG
jgi:hypothetical protein